MKKILSIAALFFTFFGASAQDSLLNKVIAPDFPFEPMFLNTNYLLSDLPKEKFEMVTKTGFTKAEVFYAFRGPKATIRLKLHADSSLKFIVKQGLINGSVTNPKDMYKIYSLEVDKKKENREFLPYAFKKGKVIPASDHNISFKKVKDDLYQLTVVNLPPGEYIIQVVTGQQANFYSFGMD